MRDRTYTEKKGPYRVRIVRVVFFIAGCAPRLRNVNLRKVESMKRGKNGAIDGRAGVGRSSH